VINDLIEVKMNGGFYINLNFKEDVMQRVFFALFVLVPIAGVFAQANYEPGVILLQVRQPNVVTFNNGQVNNGSTQLQAVLHQYPAIGSRKLSHVNANTDGWYRLEFPLTLSLSTISAALSVCPDIANVTLNYYGIACGIPNDRNGRISGRCKKSKCPPLGKSPSPVTLSWLGL
jgi:hypothetical protein